MVSNLQFHTDGEFHQYFSFSIYLLIPTRLLPAAWDYNWGCSIIGLYYSLQTNIHLNLITTNQPGFEPGSSGPKAAMLPLCYAPLTTLNKSWSCRICVIFERMVATLKNSQPHSVVYSLLLLNNLKTYGNFQKGFLSKQCAF